MSVHLPWRVAGLQFASGLQEPVSQGLDQKLNLKRTCEVYFGRFISAMIPLSQGISPRSVCAQFQKLISVWAKQRQDERSHQQAKLSGKHGFYCTEGSPLAAFALAT
jgi:hypothetical protein